MEEENDLVLSSSTLAALQEFMNEKDARKKRFEELKDEAEARHDASVTMDDFEPDWNASQFWYDQETSTTLAQSLARDATSDTVVGLVSAPSVFVRLKALMKEGAVPECQIHLFEYDRRFDIFEEFTFYDFNMPIKLPVEMKGKFDRILVDPPFLSEDCQTKGLMWYGINRVAALTVRWLSKPDKEGNEKTRVIACTGERMQDLIENKLYKQAGVKCTDLEVKHSQGLSNEFRCYSSFEDVHLKHTNP